MILSLTSFWNSIFFCPLYKHIIVNKFCMTFSTQLKQWVNHLLYLVRIYERRWPEWVFSILMILYEMLKGYFFYQLGSICNHSWKKQLFHLLSIIHSLDRDFRLIPFFNISFGHKIPWIKHPNILIPKNRINNPKRFGPYKNIFSIQVHYNWLSTTKLRMEVVGTQLPHLHPIPNNNKILIMPKKSNNRIHRTRPFRSTIINNNHPIIPILLP